MLKNALRWYYASALFGLAACHEAPEAQNQRCYAHYSDEDTITLSLNVDRLKVTGYLRFSAGADRNQGPVQGQMRGDTLLADYRLEINGQLSRTAAPIAFLRRGSGFIEGFGDIKESQGVFTFKSLAALRFDSARVLLPVACSEAAAPGQ